MLKYLPLRFNYLFDYKFRFYTKIEIFLRFKRVGSSHGRVDPNNPNKFAGASTFSADYTEHGYNRPGQIRPKENNIDFGKDGAELISSNRKYKTLFELMHKSNVVNFSSIINVSEIDYASILGTERQAPFKPKTERLSVSIF